MSKGQRINDVVTRSLKIEYKSRAFQACKMIMNLHEILTFMEDKKIAYVKDGISVVIKDCDDYLITLPKGTDLIGTLDIASMAGLLLIDYRYNSVKQIHYWIFKKIK